MVVLDLVLYTQREQDQHIKGFSGLKSDDPYAGFVLAKGKPIQRLDLGPATAINQAVQAWRAAIVKRQTTRPPQPCAGWCGSRWRGAFHLESTR